MMSTFFFFFFSRRLLLLLLSTTTTTYCLLLHTTTNDLMKLEDTICKTCRQTSFANSFHIHQTINELYESRGIKFVRKHVQPHVVLLKTPGTWPCKAW